MKEEAINLEEKTTYDPSSKICRASSDYENEIWQLKMQIDDLKEIIVLMSKNLK